MFSGTLKCQEQRLKHLKSQCQKYGLQSDLQAFGNYTLKNIINKFIVDHDHKVILKSIPKTGCSSWKTVLISNKITVNDEKITPHHWNLIVTKYQLKLLQTANCINYLNDYFVILTVRHPFARLESAFRDKILFAHNITTGIEERFSKFINSILKARNRMGMNAHWRPITVHTKPCAIPFK